MGILSFTFISTNFLLVFCKISTALDTFTPSQSISDGNTLVSRDGSFELGFFSPGSSKNRYLGIWYKNIPVKTVVWVANRLNPINDTSGLLMINSTSNLVLLSQNMSVVWSTNLKEEAKSPIVQLLHTGNLVLRDERESNLEIYLWQSFDYPSDTMLPDMKVGWDLKTGLNRRLSAWKNQDDPFPGDFVLEIELQNNPESVVWKGSEKYFRSGPWNGVAYSGTPALKPNPIFDFNFVSNEEEVYYTYHLINKSVISRLVLNQTNYLLERYTWSEDTQTWMLFSYLPKDYCDDYGLCGANGNCVSSAMPVCQCLKLFKPKSPERWNLADWSQGCVRNKPLNCQSGDGFIKFSGLKLPDATHSWVNKTMNLKECRVYCLQNCSCMAYTNSDIRGGGSGCAIWFNDLIDIRQFPAGGQDLYIRMSASELEENDEPKVKIKIAVTSVAAIFAAFGMLIIGYYICKWRTKLKGKTEHNRKNYQRDEGRKEDLELPLFDLATIADATNNFSINNKLGEGGFGPVYKGTLVDGKEIAVKRLSMSSGQGIKEFKNEVRLIAKLQHRNLVKLLGYSIEGEEKMLIYEYMPNKSLDSFIFDQTGAKPMDWSKRFHIICGIARGLLYLHQDSRLRIIHRDLKASNVLLDNELNPKISDFGMARTFGGDQTEGNTNRVVGTYGYMAPEYAIHGLFSVKSDVFSFGILLLEIISGKKNRGFCHPNSLNLIGHAWSLWNEGRPLELIDPFLGDSSCTLSEVIRCIHISLLCVQQYPEDRPCMSSVVVMLSSTESALPNPKQPGFFMAKNPVKAESSSSQREPSSINEITITLLEAR